MLIHVCAMTTRIRFVSVRECVCASVRACAPLCAHVIREIKLSFQDNAISLYHLYLIYSLNLIVFFHVGLFLCFYVRR